MARNCLVIGTMLCSTLAAIAAGGAQGADARSAFQATSASTDCANADPSSVLARVAGDFEITADPQDAAGNLIYISNVSSSSVTGPSSIVTARIDGMAGQVLAGSLTTIANNFFGQSRINGPEFVQAPTGELGVLYAGTGGVHAVFRRAHPVAWNDFKYDVTGALTFGSPPALPSTSNGAYPFTGMPFGQYTYGQTHGACLGICYAALNTGIPTDVAALLAPQGFTVVGAGAQTLTDGYIYISACDATNSCGLYEAAIDDAGGFVAGTFRMLAPIDGPTNNAASLYFLAAARHPVTRTTVLFSNGATTVNVWEQPASGGALTLIGRVPVNSSEHYRAEANTTEVVLSYLIRSGTNAGTYTVPVTATGSTLVVGASKQISTMSSGAELAWLPAANKWAIFFRPAKATSNAVERCWVTP